MVSNEVVEARENLQAKRKQTLILKSHSLSEQNISPGEIVQVYIKDCKSKRGKWTAPKVVLNTNIALHTVTGAGKNGKHVDAAFEDVRPALNEDTFAAMVQECLHELKNDLETIAEDLDNDVDKESNQNKWHY